LQSEVGTDIYQSANILYSVKSGSLIGMQCCLERFLIDVEFTYAKSRKMQKSEVRTVNYQCKYLDFTIESVK
jgi:hypothetical protein